MSKYPVVKEIFYPYEITETYSIIEESGRKGFLFTTLNIDGNYLNVINTHLYSGGSSHSEKQRLVQVTYIDSIIKSIPEFEKYPTMFAGDFNFQHPSTEMSNDTSLVYDYLHNKMNWIEGDNKIEDHEYTYDKKYNCFANKKEKRQKLDYIFWNNKCCDFLPENGEVLYTKDNCISDHNGYKFTFTMPTKVEVLVNDYLVNSNK